MGLLKRKEQKDFKVEKHEILKKKGFGYNYLVMGKMDSQTNFDGKKLTNKDFFALKYDGPSFDNNRMELHSFTKQISAVEKILRVTIDTLNKGKKIEDTSKDSKYFLELRQGSFETTIMILFANPIITNIVSNCIYDYFKYLLNKTKSKGYTKEVDSMINNKHIRKSTKDIFNPCITDADKVIIFNGVDITNNITFAGKEREVVDKHLKEIESNLPVQEYEEEFIGQIRKLDGVKAEGGLDDLENIKLCFVKESQQEPIEMCFEKSVKEKELRKIIFTRLKIKGISTYRGGELIKILVKSYNLSPKKKISDYSP